MTSESTVALAAPALLEALPDAVVVADREGRIAYVNPAIQTLL
ncbi:MAG: PAS domain-containing protein, partial [Actinomycetota bacterium]|nr:PAS domain-containing protein [Actinomycetota bacterium]